MHFECISNRCILTSYVCDGTDDCYDNTDENNCGNISLIRSNHTDRWESCVDLYHPCMSGECIPLTHMCDSKFHCQDGSDEVLCLSNRYLESITYSDNILSANFKVGRPSNLMLQKFIIGYVKV